MADRIPKILHQTWKSTSLPPAFAAWRSTWLQHHPQWEHRFYDDAACRGVMERLGPQWLEQYDRLPRPIQRVDLFRYAVLFLDGGVYADLDMVCFQPVDRLFDHAHTVLSVEAHLSARRRVELHFAKPYQLANCVLGAPAGAPFLSAFLEHLRNSLDAKEVSDDGVEDSTGPRRLTRFYYGAAWPQVRVLPQVYLMSPDIYSYIPPFRSGLYARHLTAGTWRQDPLDPGPRRRWVERSRLPPPFPHTLNAHLC